MNEFVDYIPCFTHSLNLVGNVLLNVVKKH